MGLTGQGLFWLLVVLTVAVPVAAVLLWPRLSRGRPLAITGRVGLVIASQLVTVLLVAVSVNDYAYLYGSWAEVWRSATQQLGGSSYRVRPYTVGRTQAPVVVGGISQVRPVGPAGDVRRWAKAGRLVTARIGGGTSQLTEDAYVYLPPQYYQPRFAHTVFPGVEVLSGYPSTNRMLIQRLAYQVQLLREIRLHRAQPMVLVMLRPIVTYPRDTECTNVPGGPQAETFYSQDVTAAVASSYRVAPTGWGVMGASTGGYCAAKMLMDYPALFRAGVSLSGYYHALADNTTGNLWGGSTVLRNLNDLEWRLRHQPAPPVSLLVTSSRDETGPLGYPDTQKFLSLVRRPMQVSVIISAHGTHTFTTWKPEVPGAIHWLSARLHVGAPLTAASPGTSVSRIRTLGALAALPRRAAGR